MIGKWLCKLIGHNMEVVSLDVPQEAIMFARLHGVNQVRGGFETWRCVRCPHEIIGNTTVTV